MRRSTLKSVALVQDIKSCMCIHIHYTYTDTYRVVHFNPFSQYLKILKFKAKLFQIKITQLPEGKMVILINFEKMSLRSGQSYQNFLYVI